jgi:hypothetical protein
VIDLKGGITSDTLEPGLDADEHRCVDRRVLKENCSRRSRPPPVLSQEFSANCRQKPSVGLGSCLCSRRSIWGSGRMPCRTRSYA